MKRIHPQKLKLRQETVRLLGVKHDALQDVAGGCENFSGKAVNLTFFRCGTRGV